VGIISSAGVSSTISTVGVGCLSSIIWADSVGGGAELQAANTTVVIPTRSTIYKRASQRFFIGKILLNGVCLPENLSDMLFISQDNLERLQTSCGNLTVLLTIGDSTY
jgi:hypothetical protein